MTALVGPCDWMVHQRTAGHKYREVPERRRESGMQRASNKDTLCLILYLSQHLRYLLRKFCDLYQGRSHVIQGHRSWCQSIAHGWFFIRLLSTPSSYLSPVLKYLLCNFGDLDGSRSGSSNVNGRDANRKPIDGFLYDLNCVQR